MDAGAAILERLDRIEAALRRLASSAGARTARAAGGPHLTTAEALAILCCSRTTLDGLAARGLCRQVRRKGKGRGKPVLYVRAEIEALAESEEAAAELVARAKRSRAR